MMKKIYKNKHGTIAVEKPIVWIIGILIFALLLSTIFKADILRLLRNLPIFSIFINNGNGNGNGNGNIIPENCIIMASVGKPEGGERFISVNNEKTKLYWNLDNKKIMLYQSLGIDMFREDIEIGVIENEQIKIENVLLDETSKSYKEFKEKGLPDVETLKILDGSKYFSGDFLCKEKEIIISPTDVTEEDLVNKMNSYINPKGKKGCDCGDNCIDYIKWIKKYSNINSFDYTWVLALMIQESGCDYSASSSYDSYGLMQIQESSFNDNCKKSFGVAYSFDKIKIGENYVEKNIECGILILKKKYNDYNKGVKESTAYKTDYKGFRTDIADPCINQYPKYENYKDIDATLRAYNGWGCGSGADLDYVEKIQKIREYLISGVS